MTTESKPTKRAWVKFDKYMWDFYDQNGMTNNQRLILIYLATETQWQDKKWTGSIVDISSRTRISRKVCRDTVNYFVENGMLRCEKDFKNNGMAIFELVCYEEVIIPEKKKSGRPVGSKDSYRRQRTEPEENQNESEWELDSPEDETVMNQNEQIDRANNNKNQGNRNKSHREAARREVEMSVECTSTNTEVTNFEEILSDLNPKVILSSNVPNPCSICGKDEVGHPWASVNGNGHDWTF